MIRVYQFRLYPTRAQRAAMDTTNEHLRTLWNAALQQRKEAYARQRVTLRGRDQEKELIALRAECPEFAGIHTHLLQDVLTRLDRAYDGFFARVKDYKAAFAAWRRAGSDPKKKPPSPGPPRFKGYGRYSSFTFKDVVHRNGAALVAGEKRLRLTGIGKVKIRLHGQDETKPKQYRPIEGRIKQITVKVTDYGHVFASIICDNVPLHPLPATGLRTALDMGLENLAILPDEEIPNPRFFRQAEAELARAQRRVDRKKKGSRRQKKARGVVARRHARTANARKDYHHKVARKLVQQYDVIAHEGDLNIAGMARGLFGKSIHDAGMSAFLLILQAKAENAGRETIGVKAAGTSQECPGLMPDGTRCTARVPKGLRVRVHHCAVCGLATTRDRAAAGVVHWRAYGEGPGRGLRGGATA